MKFAPPFDGAACLAHSSMSIDCGSRRDRDPARTLAERQLLIIVRTPGSSLDRHAVLAYLGDKVAKCWLPADVQFVDELPHTGTGKVSKRILREPFANAEATGVAAHWSTTAS